MMSSHVESMCAWPNKQSGQLWCDVRADDHLDLSMAHYKAPPTTDQASTGLSNGGGHTDPMAP